MKTILVTGSTDGIGKLVAIKLAKDNHQIILHGRNIKKLQKIISEIKELTNNDSVRGFITDFSNFDGVQKLIIELIKTYPKIDIIINNAGIFKSNTQKNQDDLDIRFVVNYFAPYILTNGLVPLLKKSSSPRVINLSSAAQATVSLETLLGRNVVSSQEAYAQSKLALTMWSFAFAKAYPEITTIAVNPGSLLNTKMANEAYGQHWSPATKGSDILYDLAVADEYKDMTGKYFDNDKGNPRGIFTKAHPDAYNDMLISKLIENTEDMISSEL